MSDEIYDSISTRSLRLVDSNGTERAVLATSNDGVFLDFLDGSSKPRGRVGLTDDGRTVVEISRGEGIPNLSMTCAKDGHLLIDIFDGEGIQRIKLEVKGNGSHTELSFHEKNRKPRMVLIAEDKGPAGLFIMDQHGRALFSTTP